MEHIYQMSIEITPELRIFFAKLSEDNFTRTKHLHNVARHVDARRPVAHKVLRYDTELVTFRYSEAHQKILAALCVPGPQGRIELPGPFECGAAYKQRTSITDKIPSAYALEDATFCTRLVMQRKYPTVLVDTRKPTICQAC